MSDPELSLQELPEEFQYAEEWYFVNNTKMRDELLERLEAYAEAKKEEARAAEKAKKKEKSLLPKP